MISAARGEGSDERRGRVLSACQGTSAAFGEACADGGCGGVACSDGLRAGAASLMRDGRSSGARPNPPAYLEASSRPLAQLSPALVTSARELLATLEELASALNAACPAAVARAATNLAAQRAARGRFVGRHGASRAARGRSCFLTTQSSRRGTDGFSELRAVLCVAGGDGGDGNSTLQVRRHCCVHRENDGPHP